LLPCCMQNLHGRRAPLLRRATSLFVWPAPREELRITFAFGGLFCAEFFPVGHFFCLAAAPTSVSKRHAWARLHFQAWPSLCSLPSLILLHPFPPPPSIPHMDLWESAVDRFVSHGHRNHVFIAITSGRSPSGTAPLKRPRALPVL